MAAWLLCPRQGGAQVSTPSGLGGGVITCASVSPWVEHRPPQGVPGLLAFRRALFPLQGKVKPDGPGGQFHVLTLSMRQTSPFLFCPANSYSLEKPKWTFLNSLPASASQSHRSPGWSPATLLASCVTPARHCHSLNLFPHLQNGNRNPALSRFPRDLRGEIR